MMLLRQVDIGKITLEKFSSSTDLIKNHVGQDFAEVKE